MINRLLAIMLSTVVCYGVAVADQTTDTLRRDVNRVKVGFGTYSAATQIKLNNKVNNATFNAYTSINRIAGNTLIVGATKTKITYDAKGLVTAGADATTADIADSANKRYVTDAQLTVIGNTSGTNSGDQDLSGYVPKTFGTNTVTNDADGIQFINNDATVPSFISLNDAGVVVGTAAGSIIADSTAFTLYGTEVGLTSDNALTLTGTTGVEIFGQTKFWVGISIATGSNAKMGSGTLSGGTATISNTSVTANSYIFLTDTGGGILANMGAIYEDEPSRAAGTSFVVKSLNVLDSSNFIYFIIEP